MIEKKNCRQIGVLVKVHGINGEFVLRLFDEFSMDDIQFKFLLLDIDGGLVPFEVESTREKNGSDVLVKFAPIAGNEDESRYIDSPVYVNKTDIIEAEKAEGFTTYQLIGYKAYDERSGYIGVIDSIREIKNNPLFELIGPDGNEFMIPITEDFIKEIDDEKREIHFDLPIGLVDLDGVDDDEEEEE